MQKSGVSVEVEAFKRLNPSKIKTARFGNIDWSIMQNHFPDVKEQRYFYNLNFSHERVARAKDFLLIHLASAPNRVEEYIEQLK